MSTIIVKFSDMMEDNTPQVLFESIQSLTREDQLNLISRVIRSSAFNSNTDLEQLVQDIHVQQAQLRINQLITSTPALKSLPPDGIRATSYQCHNLCRQDWGAGTYDGQFIEVKSCLEV